MVNGGISDNLYKFASNYNKFYMEQDLNRIKLVLVEKRRPGNDWHKNWVYQSVRCLYGRVIKLSLTSVHLILLLNCLVSK